MSGTDARAARDALVDLLATAEIELTGSALDRLERFVALLLDANRRLNLTRVVEPADVARLHLLDALAALPVIDALGPSRALDLGSGGGVPGIPLAIARPTIRWTLVDAAGRKAEVLRSFVAELGLDGVDVIASRAEILGHDSHHREAHDLVAARACAALPVLVEYALPLTRVGGMVVAWKGPISEDELSSGANAAARLGGGPPTLRETGIPALGDHRFVLVPKVAPTDAAFPRRPGVPAMRPLS